MGTHYTTQGSVRGSCGHRHRTAEAASRCLHSDQSGCKSQGGYSDRSIVVIENGEPRKLTEEEHEEIYYSSY